VSRRIPKSIIDALRLSGESVRASEPFVREGVERIIKEQHLPKSQKIVEKLPSADEYAMKMSQLRKAAGIAGTVSAGSLMSPEEAEAAGLQTIVQKLGVGLEDAAKIKALAKSKPAQDVFEENIKALQTITDFKKNPDAYQKLGSGVDYRAFQTPSGQVLKQPKDFTEPNLVHHVAPSLTELAGLGPKTKNIELSNKLYMIQDKVNPLDDLVKKAKRPGGDPELEALWKKHDDLWKDVPIHSSEATAKVNMSPENQALEKQIKEKELELLTKQGINLLDLEKKASSLSPDQRKLLNLDQSVQDDPDWAFQKLLEHDATQKIGSVIEPNDLHAGNIGLDKSGKPTIFDTSRFDNVNVKKMSPEQKAAILQNNILKPKAKQQLNFSLNSLDGAYITNLPNSTEQILPDLEKHSAAINEIVEEQARKAAYVDHLKKAAAVGAFPTGITNPIKDISDTYTSIRQPILDATTKVGEKIADTVRPPIPLSEEAKQQERDIAGGITSMALDPANLIAPGAGMAIGAADMGLLAPKTPEEEQTIQRQLAIERLR